MIRPPDDAPPLAPTASRAEDPWLAGPGRLAFATLWASGPDPRRDALFRLAALRRNEDGGWERFERWCRPDPGGAEDGEAARATRRMAREFGVTGRTLDEADPVEEAFTAFADFLAGWTVVLPEAATLRAWDEVHSADRPGTGIRHVLSLADIATVLEPGRLASHGPALVARLLGPAFEGRPRALEPEQVRAALTLLLERVLGRDEATLAVLAHGYRLAWTALGTESPAAAEELALVLRLCEHPSVVGDPGTALFPGGALDGRLSDAVRAYDGLEDAIDAAVPAWGRHAREERRVESLAAVADDVHTLADDDRRRVDEIFQVHLPRLLEERAGEGTQVRPRRAQHSLASEIAAGFGQRELLLQHAPTGTGKTLAYLVPCLLWAYREGVRVGVATYTRALQEQAMERDVPVALELLRRAGVQGIPRVALLKGRENYLCWRALRLETPTRLESAEDVLAWMALALFGLSDETGDLDRFPLRPPLASLLDGGRSTLARLVRRARAESGCCSHQVDRDTCGAEAARRRASGAHLVITNHAFALARREFFRHLVFDECEHLHDVAHNAFSHTLPVRRLHELLERLHRPGSGRSPLERLRATLSAGGDAAAALEACLLAREASGRVLERLSEALLDFHEWREEAERGRNPADQHSLFREYVLDQEPFDLLETHAALAAALNALSAHLAQLSEHLDTTPLRGAARVRRTLDVLRLELEERLAAVEAWIPRAEGNPSFRPETFYDLERNPRGDDVLAARVLLPHEYLGQQYYPDLWGAVLLSATTWLRGGFEAQAGFLGLTRAAHPRADEERFPCTVRTFRTEETFDYGRVLVGVPRDAPSIRSGKEGFLEYVTNFLGFLAERTRGRVLALFTNADDVQRVGRRLEPFLNERHVPVWYQRMEGTSKEELSELFRSTVDSVLLGLDTFWYGADFPGNTLEYLVLVRLPYGVPDSYHHAQCAAIGSSEQRKQIYMPRALAKFRQGFGRLMRRESDRGCVFVLDNRVLDPRHRAFLRELPVANPFEEGERDGLARLVVGDTDRVLHEALAHMDMRSDVQKRGLERSFRGFRARRGGDDTASRVEETPTAPRSRRPAETPPRIEPGDLPY